MARNADLRLAAFAVMLLLCAAATPAFAIPVVNGGFETSDTTGWSIVAGNVDVTGIWQPAEGYWSLDLNGTTAGTLAQTVATTPGRAYSLNFMMSANPDGAPPISAMEVYWDDVLLDVATYDRSATGNTRANMFWQAHHYDVVATGETGTMKFHSLVGSYWGPTLDDVSVTDVPEPATAALFALGALCILAHRRRQA